jgi:hypothetical protein
LISKLVKTNEAGRRIGDSHPRAKLSDHEIELLAELLEARQAMIDRLTEGGAKPHVVGLLLEANDLSFRCLAIKFEISKSHVAHVAAGRRRCQSP